MKRILFDTSLFRMIHHPSAQGTHIDGGGLVILWPWEKVSKSGSLRYSLPTIHLKGANLKRPAFLPALVSISLAFIIFLITACGDDNTVTVYSLKKLDDKPYGHEWLPLNPTKYTLKANAVVSETVCILSKYENCTVLSADDWECQYDDKSGMFGFRNGRYWEYPRSKYYTAVSRWEYNKINCEWAIDDESSGPFWGLVGCVIGWL